MATLAVAPSGGNVRALAGRQVDTGDNLALRDVVIALLREQGAEYEARPQLCTDLDRTAVEDGRARWPEYETAGAVRIGRSRA